MIRPPWVRIPFAAAAIVLAAVGGGVRWAVADDIALDNAAGTIALVSGKGWVRHGEITLPTPESEGTTSPNVSFNDLNGRELGPNDHIQAGDVVITGEDSYLKIYFKDDSIMDVGPNTTFKVTQFQLADPTRKISFTLLQGKVRTLVTRSLDSSSFYRVTTPTSAMGVHGTEWVTNSYPENGQYRTDVTVLEGKVVVDVQRPMAGNSKPNLEQVPVTPGKTFSGVGNGGSVSKFSLFKLSNDQIKELAAMVPNIETTRVGDVPMVAAAARAPESPAGSPTSVNFAAERSLAAAAPAPTNAPSAGRGPGVQPVVAAAEPAPAFTSGGAAPVVFHAATAPAAAPASVGAAAAAAVPGNAPALSSHATIASVPRVTPAVASAPIIAARSVAASPGLTGAPGLSAASLPRPSLIAVSAASAATTSLGRPGNATAAASQPPTFKPIRAHLQAPPAVLAPPTTSATPARAR